jgi:hypothetical protein
MQQAAEGGEFWATRAARPAAWAHRLRGARSRDGSCDSLCRAKYRTGCEPPPDFWLYEGKSDGHGWFRTSDLSRVKRALSH